MDMSWKVGSLGLAPTRAMAAVAEAAPIRAEVQFHFTFLPMTYACIYSLLHGLLLSSDTAARRDRGLPKNKIRMEAV